MIRGANLREGVFGFVRANPDSRLRRYAPALSRFAKLVDMIGGEPLTGQLIPADAGMSVVGRGGIEPPTTGLKVRCSTN